MADFKNIAIYGAGGFGREVACLLNIINSKELSWNLVGFFDDTKEIGTPIDTYGVVIGGIDELNNWNSGDLNIAIAIGSPSGVKQVYSQITNNNILFPNLIAPDTIFLDRNNTKLGIGNIICSMSFVSCSVTIGDFNIFNINSTIGHDALIGSFNTLMPAVRVSGNVKIGDYNFFGVSSVILQQIKIGDAVRLGAGSVLMTKPKNGELYIGNPALRMKY